MTWATVQCMRAVSSATRSHAWARAPGIHGSHARVLAPSCWAAHRLLTSSSVLPNKSGHARQQFREDGLAEREADAKDEKEAEKRGFDPSKYNSQDGDELNERLTFREEASAERVADAQNVDAAERRGYKPDDYKKRPSEEAVRKDFQQDAAAEYEADAKDLAAAEKRGYNPADYEKSGESDQDKMRDDFREDALAEREADQENDAAARRRGFNRYPASFVLPTTVPHIDRLTKSEAHHRQKLLHLLNLMNLPQFLHAFAYGSGVFSQTATAKRQPNGTPPMIDMVISVQNPVHWHSRNIINNPSHYPWWVRVAPWWVLRRVQNMGAGVWYIPYVKVEDKIVKYGVVSVDRMCKDLLQWDSLYLSGRMQKPVATLFDSTEGRVPLAEQANLASALRVSFLLLPERFSERELYTKMASLSYMGDFRMRVPGGENKNKIRNIVENQHTWFRFMCADLITRFRFVTVESNPDKEWLQFKQNVAPSMRASIASNLPKTLRKRIIKHYLSTPSEHPLFKELAEMGVEAFDRSATTPQTLPQSHDLSEEEAKIENLASGATSNEDQLPPLITRFWLAVVQQDNFKEVLMELIATTVKKPAEIQSLKGLFTAGVTRSIRYLLSKFSKYREGQKSE